MALLELCHEVLQHVLEEVETEDLPSLSLTCHALRSFIRSNRLLWKTHYLKLLDDPSTDTEAEWEALLPKYIQLKRVLSQPDKKSQAHIPLVTKRIDHLLHTSTTSIESSRNIAFLSQHFSDRSNIDTFLCSSSLFDRAGTESQQAGSTEEEQQCSAKLHVLYGVPIDPCRTMSRATHPYARSRVYDLRRYTEKNHWGPFTNDGEMRVDWERLESVMIVLGYNLRLFSERTNGRFDPLIDRPWLGVTPNSFISTPVRKDEDNINETKHDSPMETDIDESQLLLEAQDPYGITGTWMRVVCFLDYTDLYAFNFENDEIDDSEEREPLETTEAIRLIILKLRVTKIEDPGEEDGQMGPVVWFKGTSHSLHTSWDPNANSRIRGRVSRTPEGHVRWTTWSIFHGGEERWRSETIQLGGLKSARGTMGTWFDKDYDPHGPAGPTAFWKISDDVVEMERRPVLPMW